MTTGNRPLEDEMGTQDIDPAGMERARRVAGYEIGDRAWADMIIRAYLAIPAPAPEPCRFCPHGRQDHDDYDNCVKCYCIGFHPHPTPEPEPAADDCEHAVSVRRTGGEWLCAACGDRPAPAAGTDTEEIP